jgi:hypothetical protein
MDPVQSMLQMACALQHANERKGSQARTTHIRGRLENLGPEPLAWGLLRRGATTAGVKHSTGRRHPINTMSDKQKPAGW